MNAPLPILIYIYISYGLRLFYPQGFKARESDERKIELRNRIEIKRLFSAVNKAKEILEGKDTEPVEKNKRPPGKVSIVYHSCTYILIAVICFRLVV